MKATDANLLDFIEKTRQFVIPIYQRTYSWTERECRQLWKDIRRTGHSADIPVHFLGSVVYVEESLSNASNRAPLLVIDGQQRLATVTLLLAALSRKVGDDEPIDGFSSQKIRNRYLMNRDEDGERAYKLLLSKTDRATLKAIVSGDMPPDSHSARIAENFDLFSKWLGEDGAAVSETCAGLAKLKIVDVALSREHDNPQLIFESMNSTGKELSQADLIRNFVLMNLEPRLQDRLYERYWRRMEEGFGQAAHDSRFDRFMRNYLTVVTGSIPRINDVYDDYKVYFQKQVGGGREVEDLLGEVREYSQYYGKFALGQEREGPLAIAFGDLRALDVKVAYPFLLEVHKDQADGRLSAEDFLEIVRLVEAYVFRRAVCSLPTNSLNKTFATLGRELDKDRYLESVKACLLHMKSYRRFPLDGEFIEFIQRSNLYNFRSAYWLRKLENFGTNEQVKVEGLTIEHIMPQNKALSAAWRESLGPSWAIIQERWLHTLGNLTLTGYNSQYGDRSFAQKRDMDGGFKDSPLRLNKGLGSLETWNEDEIKKRARVLARRATKVWAAPSLSAEVLATHRAPVEVTSRHGIEDHPNLAPERMGGLFGELRRGIAGLDPSVSEHFLKNYVAYKAETNFADVTPLTDALKIFLNIDFYELSDPRKMVIDPANVGRWGNWNTEVRLRDRVDLPYVLGLVRQALDRQL